MSTSPRLPARVLPRILVVDDSDHVRMLVCSVFERSGFVVVEAASGETGLITAASESIDGVLADVEMPGMSGIELCRKLGRLESVLNRKIPVWIMTGSGRPDIESEARIAGAKAVFRKPFEASTVVNAVKSELSEGIEMDCS